MNWVVLLTVGLGAAVAVADGLFIAYLSVRESLQLVGHGVRRADRFEPLRTIGWALALRSPGSAGSSSLGFAAAAR